MPDFDSAIAKTVAAHQAVVAAARAVGEDIAQQRQAEQAESPVVLPAQPVLPPIEG